MPGPRALRITDGTSGSRGAEGDQTPARWADGSSAGPGGSPHEPGGVSAKATIPGDMQQTGQIHPRAERRRETASVAGPASKAGPARMLARREPMHAGARVPFARAAHGRPYQKSMGATGAASRLAVPHAPPFRGRRKQATTGKPLSRSERGADDARLNLALFVMAGLVPAIHVFLAELEERRGCPGQARA